MGRNSSPEAVGEEFGPYRLFFSGRKFPLSQTDEKGQNKACEVTFGATSRLHVSMGRLHSGPAATSTIVDGGRTCGPTFPWVAAAWATGCAAACGGTGRWTDLTRRVGPVRGGTRLRLFRRRERSLHGPAVNPSCDATRKRPSFGPRRRCHSTFFFFE